MSKRRYKYWVLRSPSGELYKVYSLRDFVESHPEDFPNVKTSLRKFYHGGSARDWEVVSRQAMDGSVAPPPAKKLRTFWTLRSPSGEVYGVPNLKQFLRDHPEDFPNVDSAASSFSLAAGTDRTVLGWSVLPNLVPQAKITTWRQYRCYKLLTCRDCGREYTGHIRTIRCPECQAEANRRYNVEYRQRKRAGQVREIGSTAICEWCGEKYTVDAARQLYCKECAPTAIRERCNQNSREWRKVAYAGPEKRAFLNERSRAVPLPHTCTVCGKEFYAIGKPLYCSEECRQEAKKEYHIQYVLSQKEKIREDAKKRRDQLTPEEREQRNAQSRERWANRTPEQKEHKNAQARERYAKRTPEQREKRNAQARERYARQKNKNAGE